MPDEWWEHYLLASAVITQVARIDIATAQNALAKITAGALMQCTDDDHTRYTAYTYAALKDDIRAVLLENLRRN